MTQRDDQDLATSGLTRALDVKGGGGEVMRRILENAALSVGADIGFVERVLDDDWVEIVAGTGAGVPELGSRVPFPGSLTGEVTDGEPEVVENVALVKRPIGAMLEASCGACSGLILPLAEGGTVLGALVLLRRPKRSSFLPEEVERVRLLGSVASLALHRDQLLRESRQAHDELALSRQKYETLYHSNPTIYLTTDERGVLISVNRFGAEAMRFTVDELVGRDAREIVHPSSRAAFEEHLDWCLAHPDDVHRTEIEKVRGDGTSMFVREAARAIRDREGGTTVYHVCDDVTEEVRVRDALRRSSEQHAYLAEAGRVLASSLDFHRTLENIAWLAVPRIADWCTVHLVEDDGSLQRVTISHADPSREALVEEYHRRFPVDPESPAGPPNVVRTGVAEHYPEVSDELLRGVAKHEDQYRMLRDLGFRSGMIVPMKADDRVLGAITLISAESGRRYDEADLEFARNLANRAALSIVKARLYRDAQEASRVRDEVLAIVSHDLRNPLGTIMMSSGFLIEEDPSPELWRKQVEVIHRSAQRMNHLISDLLDVSKIESGTLAVDPTPMEPRELILEAVTSQRMAARQADLQLDCRVDERLPRVCADRERIQQVLGNLLGNALKFTPSGGSIEVQAGSSDGEVFVEVCDTGPGIPEEELPHLFERFWQSKRTRRGGAGLGLAISRGIVEAHGGRLTVRSRPGEGSRFRFTLPAAPES
jgi:PAS domain S-box-containing protein